MTVTVRAELSTGSSQLIVATAVSSQLQQQNHNEFVLGAPTNGRFVSTNVVESSTGRSLGTQITKSLMPGRAQLNAAVQRSIVEGLMEQAVNALELKNEGRLRADIPTADYVTRGSFKVGSKLLIKIDPTSKDSKLNDYLPQLTFNQFSLQGVAEPDEERYQLHETFESEILFLFGRRPRIWTLQGIVLNGRRAPEFRDPRDTGVEDDEEKAQRLAKNMDFANTLLQDWEDFYRGSKAVESKSRTYITYEDSLIEGTLLGLTIVRNAQIPSAVNATLTFVVHQRAFLGQEYREGISAPNLADMIANTNAAGPFSEKVNSDGVGIAGPTPEELARQEAVSGQELLTSQEALRGTLEEKEALETQINENAAGPAAVQQAEARSAEIGPEVSGAVAAEEDATAKNSAFVEMAGAAIAVGGPLVAS
jgi:hypothetical protein